jgi:hypothetical protein
MIYAIDSLGMRENLSNTILIKFNAISTALLD